MRAIPILTLQVVLWVRVAVAEPQTEAPVDVVVAYDTRTGHTESLARAIIEGVREVEGVEGRLRRQTDVEDEEILGAEGILVGSPVHWGSLSADTKRFLDRVGAVLLAHEEIGERSAAPLRAAGAFVTGGSLSSGKELARLTILAAFLNMRFVVVGAEDSGGFGTLGAAATTGPSDPGLSDEELDEARRFGRRFAETTLALVR